MIENRKPVMSDKSVEEMTADDCRVEIAILKGWLTRQNRVTWNLVIPGKCNMSGTLKYLLDLGNGDDKYIPRWTKNWTAAEALIDEMSQACVEFSLTSHRRDALLWGATMRINNLYAFGTGNLKFSPTKTLAVVKTWITWQRAIKEPTQ